MAYTEEEVKELKIRKGEKISVICYSCGKEFERYFVNALKNIEERGHIYCPSCQSKITNSKMDFDARTKKTKETAIKRYGSVEEMWKKRNEKTKDNAYTTVATDYYENYVKGYVRIWSSGNSTFAIDNLKITNLDKDGVVVDTDYKSSVITAEDYVLTDEDTKMVFREDANKAQDDKGLSSGEVLIIVSATTTVVLIASATVISFVRKKKKGGRRNEEQ
jgi:DNA-directed RNA polymerase subunit RPC12/RpoP